MTSPTLDDVSRQRDRTWDESTLLARMCALLLADGQPDAATVRAGQFVAQRELWIEWCQQVRDLSRAPS